MPTTDAIIGYGSKIAYSTDGGSNYTDVAEVVDLGPPKQKAKDVDITNLDSANRYREFMAGLKEGGEVQFKFLFAKAVTAAVYALFGTTYTWRVTFADLSSTASKWVMSGYINELGGVIPLDDKVEVEVKVKVTGKPTFTAGT